MLPLQLDPTTLFADPIAAVLLLSGAVITGFTVLAGAYLTLGAVGDLVTSNGA
ncbi:hypothetical protein [Halocalculus aciditolerans]|uniref:Uncharacterized protein n=1 Tax=Halocalculus aciditolerans TaxID=1383812 RepID=A0A830FPZ7_9EURY|nr:hypothetical protein [Halocalculus aciditolerans]GGL68921.1 hypothetical protein GCM10009039_28630 [Halocalculus aciditolerans]